MATDTTIKAKDGREVDIVEPCVDDPAFGIGVSATAADGEADTVWIPYDIAAQVATALALASDAARPTNNRKG